MCFCIRDPWSVSNLMADKSIRAICIKYTFYLSLIISIKNKILVFFL